MGLPGVRFCVTLDADFVVKFIGASGLQSLRQTEEIGGVHKLFELSRFFFRQFVGIERSAETYSSVAATAREFDSHEETLGAYTLSVPRKCARRASRTGKIECPPLRSPRRSGPGPRLKRGSKRHGPRC